MAGELTMRLEAMASAAQVLANQADDLHAELESISRDWRELSETWTGVAASAFEPPWEEWHHGAVMAANMLMEHSQLLVRAVDMMLDHENIAARAFAALNPKDPPR